MAEITRDVFPPNILQRMNTPIPGRNVVGNIMVSRDRPWGGIVYPEPQQSDTPRRGRVRKFLGL